MTLGLVIVNPCIFVLVSMIILLEENDFSVKEPVGLKLSGFVNRLLIVKL